MLNFGNTSNSFDAIVIGTGISGGWAAKELCELGLKTLVLERGRLVRHIEDYPTMHKDPWDFKVRGGRATQEELKDYEKLKRTGFATREEHRHFFVKDSEHPYNEVKRFDWVRGYQVGGKSLIWGRCSYRLGDLDFEANLKQGIAVDWPVRYKDIAPWYDYVEGFAGISGENLGLPQLPDGNLLPPMPLNCLEDHFRQVIYKDMDGRVVMPQRVAHLTGNKTFDGRTNCQYRDRCMRGCPFGGYFSSNSSTLPAAEKTGNMTIRPHSIVHEIVYDADKKRATGVKIIDAETKEEYVFNAKVIFCCASSMASASILLQSKSDRFPNGLGNDSGELGHNIMDHHFNAGASGTFEGFEDKYYKGRKPSGFYIPRFRNLDEKSKQKDFIRGYGYEGGAGRSDWKESVAEISYGKSLTESILKPGPWQIGMTAFGETLPNHDNKMYLDYDKLDAWGLPTITFDAQFGENELNMRKDMIAQAVKMLEKAGVKNIQTEDNLGAPGLGIHEMGTARMGRDPKTSVLNGNNQVHTVPNVYVTDGACMTSSACQNPSLTYMALTARAAHHAVEQLKKMSL